MPPIQPLSNSPAVNAGQNKSAEISGGPVITVQLLNAGGEQVDIGNALVLAPGNRIVLPLNALYQVSQGKIVSNSNNIKLGKVAGINSEANLAVIELNYFISNFVNVPETESLYLGLELDALLSATKIAGVINTSILQNKMGLDVYGYQLNSAQQPGFTGLTLAGSNDLAGILSGNKTDNTLYETIDASKLSFIRLPANFNQAPEIAEFSQVFFNHTFEGRFVSLHKAAQNKNWQYVLNTGEQLLGSRVHGESLISMLAIAYLELTKNALESGDTSQARALLNRAQGIIGDNIEIKHALAHADMSDNNPQQALQTLFRAIDARIANDDTYALIEKIVPHLVQSPHLSSHEKQQLLEQVIQYQSGIAYYHAELGKQYYAQNDYANSLTQFNYATQLKPDLYNSLSTMMKNARTRLNNPDNIIVPLISNGNSYMVDIRINGISKRLMLDTGASITAISTSLAQELSISTNDRSRHIQLATANGLINAPLAKADTIEMSGAKVSDLDIVIIDRMQGNGLLGLNFLNHFNIDINQASNEMTLGPVNTH